MKNFWENYKKNLKILIDFSKEHWKALVAICFTSSFIVHAVNFVLSVYIIDPKYFWGDGHVLPDMVVVIMVLILTECAFKKYLKTKNNLDS